MIKNKSGDISERRCRSTGQPVNCVGVMAVVSRFIQDAFPGKLQMRMPWL
jgi:hypothetical protein